MKLDNLPQKLFPNLFLISDPVTPFETYNRNGIRNPLSEIIPTIPPFLPVAKVLMLINILAFPPYILPPSGFPVRSRGSFIPMQVTHCLLRGESNKETLPPSFSPRRCSCCSRENNRCSSSLSLFLSLSNTQNFHSSSAEFLSPQRSWRDRRETQRDLVGWGEGRMERRERDNWGEQRRDFFQVKLRPLILLTSDREERERERRRCRWLLEILSKAGCGEE